MHGNVWEWCKDGVRKYAERSEAVLNPIGLQGQDAFRMVRGGSWNFDAGYLRAAVRLQSSPGNRNDHLGLRIVLRSTNLVEEPQAAEQAQGARGLLNQHSQAF